MSKTQNANFLSIVLKGVAVTLIVNLIGILIFGVIVKIGTLNNGVIKAVNQFIKVLSVFLGCYFCIKGELGFLKGLIIGVLSTFLIYLIFGIISGSKVFSVSLLLDIIFLGVIGLISGAVVVNLKKNSYD